MSRRLDENLSRLPCTRIERRIQRWRQTPPPPGRGDRNGGRAHGSRSAAARAGQRREAAETRRKSRTWWSIGRASPGTSPRAKAGRSCATRSASAAIRRWRWSRSPTSTPRWTSGARRDTSSTSRASPPCGSGMEARPCACARPL